MSINFYTLVKAKLFFLTASLFFAFIITLQAHAVIGYEENTNIMIDTTKEISEIDIGNDILYYDFHVQEYRNGFVNFRDNTISGIKIEVKEVESDENRVFFIDYEN